ncbi:hypothetical protein KDK95_01370 [Actinospica sp. MGRD01-02]|uniref:Uncharacterized protein n=1 Tax=Actinospica acidithermotolerans TaxID=2828514 RepID=A0A941IFE0_9ACTN|nr:hypothetical protein [Actinospica acidithermotolerans]MBR7824939.1 hypothetical protein [Actinospica acidithermotolerans]
MNSSTTPSDTVDSTREIDATSGAEQVQSTAYLSPAADVYSEPLLSLEDEGDRTESIVGNWLRPRLNDDVATMFISQAADDFALWLAVHDSKGPATVTVGWESPRVLVELTDHGTATPDLHRSRNDLAMCFRMLGHYVIEWRCDADDDGNRTTRLYADTNVSNISNPEEREQ